MTPAQEKQLTVFRSKHAIVPIEKSRGISECGVCGVRVVSIKGGGFRHRIHQASEGGRGINSR